MGQRAMAAGASRDGAHCSAVAPVSHRRDVVHVARCRVKGGAVRIRRVMTALPVWEVLRSKGAPVGYELMGLLSRLWQVSPPVRQRAATSCRELRPIARRVWHA